MRRSLVTAFRQAALVMLLLVTGVVRGAGNNCDQSLPSPVDDALAYRERGDRCEGRYIKEVGNTTLLTASFTAVIEPFDPGHDARLAVTWPRIAGAQEVRVRAQGLKRRQYYRMDTRRPASDSSYVWPTAVLISLEIGPKDYGVVVSTPLRIAQTERTVLLPARVERGHATVPSQNYELVVVPGIQLDELSVAMTELAEDGSAKRVALAPAPLLYGFYPAERAVSIPLPLTLFGARGFYRVDLVAKLQGGGSSRTEAWLFHPGP